MRRLDCITNSMDINLSKFREMVKDGEPGMLQSKGSQTVGHDLETELNLNVSIIDFQKQSYEAFPPAWVLRWALKWELLLKSLPHSVHL